MNNVRYRGRFAPSPTGLLHIGSLIAAVSSYLCARSQQGEWWLRIEDIDPQREMAGAADQILFILEAYGFEWDNLSYQHSHLDRYHQALSDLRLSGLIYPCTCSRKLLAETHPDQHIYPGTCRKRSGVQTDSAAWRIRCATTELRFLDSLQGEQCYDLANDIGDFVIKRADGLFSYQLAVALDDAQQGMTHVVRGVDLLDSTPRQIYLQQCLKLPTPQYLHVPVVINRSGQKLSKQTLAPHLEPTAATESIWTVLSLLGQNPPPELRVSQLNEIWGWAITHWDLSRIPRQRQITLDKTGNQADKTYSGLT